MAKILTRLSLEISMADETSTATHASEQTSQIAHDLREYARAGVEPAFASKLLAAAAELDALATRRKRKRAVGND
jgi:hypothetical protein